MPHALFPTKFGTCGIAWNEAGLTCFQLPDDTEALTEERMAARGGTQPGAPPAWVRGIIARVQLHLEGNLQDFSGTALDRSCASDFQMSVYVQTQAIKPGFKKSYGEIARLMALGNESARAVGMALAANPWPLIVPCHRVVSAGGKMTGFSAPGGVRTKTRLLALEGAELLSE
ncbi:MAG TPA: methylated-DNA--[protein]-cysteine S-methyltransferase [Opitutaceae bacterium]|nr:methylated-DNA--[protein]-cysteine S-methyltransferase [Opitutaceae bacterium]